MRHKGELPIRTHCESFILEIHDLMILSLIVFCLRLLYNSVAKKTDSKVCYVKLKQLTSDCLLIFVYWLLLHFAAGMR